MSDQAPLWISEAQVASLMGMEEAIRALENGLLLEARGEAHNMVKTHVAWGDGATLHAIGAAFPTVGLVGTKTWAHTPGGATPLLVLFDSNTGALRAIIEAFVLGQMRTGSASGLATKWLAGESADELAIIGSGKQALAQVAAVLAVRPLRRIRVFGRNEERRSLFVTKLQDEFGIEVVACRSVAEAVDGAPIVTLATRATEPILFADMLARGTHINAIGAIVPTACEVASDVVARASQIVVDSVPQAQKLSRELIRSFGADASRWSQVRSLAELVARQQRRAPAADLTLFKSLGMGISDLSLGIELYQKALERGLGRRLEHPQKATLGVRAASRK